VWNLFVVRRGEVMVEREKGKIGKNGVPCVAEPKSQRTKRRHGPLLGTDIIILSKKIELCAIFFVCRYLLLSYLFRRGEEVRRGEGGERVKREKKRRRG
jgi:hypothetical protein